MVQEVNILFIDIGRCRKLKMDSQILLGCQNSYQKDIAKSRKSERWNVFIYIAIQTITPPECIQRLCQTIYETEAIYIWYIWYSLDSWVIGSWSGFILDLCIPYNVKTHIILIIYFKTHGLMGSWGSWKNLDVY